MLRMMTVGARGLVGTAAAIAVVGCGSSSHSNGSGASQSPGWPNTAKTIQVGSGASNIAVDSGSVWVRTDAGAVRVDPKTAAVSPPATVPQSVGNIEGLTVAGGSVWAGVQPSGSGSDLPGSIYRFDATTGRPIGSPIKLPARFDAIGAGADAVWVVSGVKLLHVDTSTGKAVTEPATVPLTSSAVAVSGSTVWIPNHDTPGEVVRVNANTGRRVDPPTRVGGNPNDITANDRSVWTDDDNKGATQINSLDGLIRKTVQLPGNANGLAIDGTNLWVTSDTNLAQTISRFSASGVDNTPAGVPMGGGYASGVAAGAGATWITSSDGSSLTRIPG